MGPIAGLRVRSLEDVPSGGWTIFDATDDTGITPLQWNVVRSRPHVLRGVHVHVRHDDYLVLLRGRASIGLRDLREGSPTYASVDVVELDGDRPEAITIPHGVAHGFYFHDESLHVYSVSHYWDMEDELGCHWSDPELAIPWRLDRVHVSPRDAGAPALADLVEQLRRHQPFADSATSVTSRGL